MPTYTGCHRSHFCLPRYRHRPCRFYWRSLDKIHRNNGTDGTTDTAYDDTSEDVSDITSDEINDGNSEDVSGDSSEDASDDAAEDASDDSTEDISDDATVSESSSETSDNDEAADNAPGNDLTGIFGLASDADDETEEHDDSDDRVIIAHVLLCRSSSFTLLNRIIPYSFSFRKRKMKCYFTKE